MRTSAVAVGLIGLLTAAQSTKTIVESSAKHWYEIGREQLSLDRLQEAQAALSEAVRLQPEQWRYQDALGTTLLRQRRWQVTAACTIDTAMQTMLSSAITCRRQPSRS